MANVLSTPTLGKSQRGHRGQIEHIVQLAIGEQSAIGGDPRPVELELEPAVEGDPERWLLGFTRRIRHDQPISPLLCL